MSKIQVDAVEQQSGTTVTVGGGACKTAVVDATTVTLGRSGGTVSLAPGASQSGFGRTGTVDWCTTAKTGPFTAANGVGYFVNTASGAITVTLPASPSAGDIVAFKDYSGTWDAACKAVSVANNGSKINGVCGGLSLTTEGQSLSLIYVDATKGWQDVNDSTANVTGAPSFMSATGGTITTCGDYKIHTFTANGCFAVTTGASAPNNVVSYVVVAGGAGSASGGGGGGAGGYREGKCSSDPYADSPLDSGSGLPVSSQTYPITVGAGGAAGPTSGGSNGASGSNSTFSTITSAGGGGGGKSSAGANGGSGGGSHNASGVGSGNTPPVSPPQGNDGGAQGPDGQGAGGGATGVG